MADKKYKLKFTMTDGTEQSVEFAVPNGGSPVYPCTDGTYFWRELDEVDPVTGSNRVYLHPPKEPYYNKGVKNTANIFRTDEEAVLHDGTVKGPVYCATVVVPLSNFDPDMDGDSFGLVHREWVSVHAVAYENGYFNQLPWINNGHVIVGSVVEYDAGLQITWTDYANVEDVTVVMTIKYVR